MAEPLLELAQVARTFPGPPPVHALRAATLAVHPGEMVAVTGHSGSGKSTLLNIMGLLDDPTSGVRRIDGIDTATLRERDRVALRASSFGFAFQAYHLIGHLDSVANVSLPLVHQGVPRRDRRPRAEAALRRVGLGHRLDARPTTLSGGEQQRVAIARALVHKPRVLLCDEPTGNLDSENTEAVLALLRDLVSPHRAVVVVVVTHEADVRARADRMITVVDGVTHG